MRAAADAEDKTEKHPVTPGVADARARALRRDAAGAWHGEGGARRVRGDARRRSRDRLGATIGAAKAAEKAGDAAKARQYYAAVVALAESADPVRPEIADARAFMAKN